MTKEDADGEAQDIDDIEKRNVAGKVIEAQNEGDSKGEGE